MDVAELERSYNASKDKSDIKAIVIINPGNPTGQVNKKNGDWIDVKNIASILSVGVWLESKNHVMFF